LDMRHALNIALQGFEGAMVLISHDRFLLSSVCDDFYLVDNRRVTMFDGDLDDYRDWLLKAQIGTSGTETKEPKIDRKNLKRLEAEFRQATQPLRKQLAQQEKGMSDLQNKLQVLEKKMADPDLYNAENKAKLKQLLTEQAEYKADLGDTEMSWLETQEQLEEQQAVFEQASSM